MLPSTPSVNLLTKNAHVKGERHAGQNVVTGDASLPDLPPLFHVREDKTPGMVTAVETQPPKRKSTVQKRYSLSERMAALDRLKAGQSIRSLAKELNVQSSNIRHWRKRAEEVDMTTFNGNRKTLHRGRKPQGEDIEEDLSEWIHQRIRNKFPVNINDVV